MKSNLKILVKVAGCFALLWSFTVTAQANQAKKDTLRVLFVGNSFTYFYNLPQVVNAMSEFSDNLILETRHSLVGGSTLFDHLNQKKGTQTIRMLNEYSFDYVVMNHHSLATIDNNNNFFQVSKQMVELVRSKNAIPVFMQTWAYHSNPLMTHTIASTYEDMSRRLEVEVVPCGDLFSEVRKWRSDLSLFDDDDKHPSKHATYLNGLAFFKYFTNEKTINIPKRITTTDQNGPETMAVVFESGERRLFTAAGR